MAIKKLSDLVDKYSDGSGPHSGSVGFSCRISSEAKARLSALSSHFGIKKTPLAGEILETAIFELFEQAYENFHDDDKHLFYCEMEELGAPGFGAEDSEEYKRLEGTKEYKGEK